MHEFYHHEDDVGQIQVLPVEWWDYCRQEIYALEEHNEKHVAPGGVGWTKMYSFSAAAPELPNLEMTVSRFRELLSPHASEFEKITNPLSEYEAEVGIRAIGFGPSQSAGVFADLVDDMVKAIWCIVWSERDDELEVMAKLLYALSEDQHFLLVDWKETHIVDLRVGWEIENYFFGTWPEESYADLQLSPLARLTDFAYDGIERLCSLWRKRK
ncbi:MAG: hypothetical protein GY789_24450 [Hyphomicrobiales bacterium]|nr:hypothetical protein [Hyphomicrobiales bacterium]MCP5001441.1 hypothetical protein [Hyphomicrobiales bacterium]